MDGRTMNDGIPSFTGDADMKLAKAYLALSLALCACLLAGCSISDTSSSASSLPDPASIAAAESNLQQNTWEKAPSVPQPTPSPAASEFQSSVKGEDNTPEYFWSLASHDQYLSGMVTDCHFTDYPQDSYICFDADGREYRVEGSLGKNHEGLLPFHSVYSYSGKEADECRPGWQIVVYFEDQLPENETTITQPKEIYLFLPDNADIVNAWIGVTDYELTALRKNYDAMEEKEVFSPQEAMRRVAQHIGLENLQEQSTSPGIYVYTDGQHTISFQTLHYNRYYQLDRNACYELYAYDPNRAARYLDPAFPGEGILSQPFIEYEVLDQYDQCRDLYFVSITGEVSNMQTVYDMSKGILVKQ